MCRIPLIFTAATVLAGCAVTQIASPPLDGAASAGAAEAPLDANLRPAVRAGNVADTAAHQHAAAHVTYTCVMHPQVILDSPGKCPICGMALVPKDSTTKGAP